MVSNTDMRSWLAQKRTEYPAHVVVKANGPTPKECDKKSKPFGDFCRAPFPNMGRQTVWLFESEYFANKFRREYRSHLHEDQTLTRFLPAGSPA